jgi:hypothetical protein
MTALRRADPVLALAAFLTPAAAVPASAAGQPVQLGQPSANLRPRLLRTRDGGTTWHKARF